MLNQSRAIPGEYLEFTRRDSIVVGRKLICHSIKSYGSDDPRAVSSVRVWLKSNRFEEHCFLADWDEGWVRKIFSSIDTISPVLKKEITQDILGTVARLGRG